MLRQFVLSLALVVPALASVPAMAQAPTHQELIRGVNGEPVYRLTYREGSEGGVVRVLRDQHRTYVQYAGPRLPAALGVGPDGKPKDLLNSWAMAYGESFMVIDGTPKIFFIQFGVSNVLVECLGGGKFKEARLAKDGLGEQR